MSQRGMSRFRELTDVILPRVAASGRLGTDNVQLVKCVRDSDSKGEVHFASTVTFVVAVFRSDTKGQFELPLLAKFNMTDKVVRDWLKLDRQFCNEVVMYDEVLPFLDKNDKVAELFPRYFYGSATMGVDPEGFVIVLEDLRSVQFVLSPEILNLDFDHCALAFKKLGSFHALSFASKKSKTNGFVQVVNKLIETKMIEDDRQDNDYLLCGTVGRAAAPLLEKCKFVQEINNFRNKLKDSAAYFKNIYSVKEPMAVICHGDFCRNNVLFKYNNGKPVDIKFFDLATARYGSPMLDFTFFFYLNCSEQSRRQNRDEYLKIYYESLSTTFPDVEVPTLEEFKEEFLQKAVYGFLLCSFFKPAMMDPQPYNPSVEARMTAKERAAIEFANAGHEGTEVISDMLNELLELGCAL